MYNTKGAGGHASECLKVVGVALTASKLSHPGLGDRPDIYILDLVLCIHGTRVAGTVSYHEFFFKKW